jgi:hypothetical protein
VHRYVAWDQFRNNPEPPVMKWRFILVTLYLGSDRPASLCPCRQGTTPGDAQGVHQAPLEAGNRQHDPLGRATGIIVAAAVTALLGLPMWMDIIIEYAAGFALGLFVFQALLMKDMMGGSYRDNVRKSFLPEYISMNAMMAAMVRVMAVLMMGRDMRAMWPGEFLFWGVMALGIAVGFAVAYPFNVWMVAKGMKHGSSGRIGSLEISVTSATFS